MEKKEKVGVTILSVMDEISDDSGIVSIEDLYRKLRREHDLERVTAGKTLIELYKEGRIYSPRYYYLKRLKG